MAKKSGGTRAIAVLNAAAIDFSLHEYQPQHRKAAWGTEAAQALDLSADQVFKTLMIYVDGSLCVAVVPVSGSLNVKAAARVLGGKRAEMAEPQAAQRATGYVVGGISPLGQRTQHPTVIDDSALRFTSIYISGGKRGLDIELSPHDLVTLTQATVAQIRS